MGKTINGKIKYRVVVSQEKGNIASRDFPWQGKDEDILREVYCFWITQIGSLVGSKKERNGSKLEKGVKIMDVDVQISDYENKSGKREWKKHEYDPFLREPVRYNSSM